MGCLKNEGGESKEREGKGREGKMGRERRVGEVLKMEKERKGRKNPDERKIQRRKEMMPNVIEAENEGKIK